MRLFHGRLRATLVTAAVMAAMLAILRVVGDVDIHGGQDVITAAVGIDPVSIGLMLIAATLAVFLAFTRSPV
jgi:hypothetical protein